MTITPPPDHVTVDRDVEMAVRDGTILRVDVYRPDRPGRYPVLMCAHPYGKDATPKPKRGGGHRPPLQTRLLPQSRPYTISAWTGWEAPDPGYWVPRGYVVVNADLRGWGHSDGTGELLSDQEADDYHDLVEWAAAQEWSNGKVGLSGVSYLAISQWGAASKRPPHLAAISPWEGFSDAYRDFMRPGGIREDGFAVVWAKGLGAKHESPVTVRTEQKARPLFDDWWRARNRDLEAIDVPALICGSFSDHNLHSAGSFNGFLRIGSAQKWLYTHRGPKWATYYGPQALAFQARFFDHFLRGDDNGMESVPPVRLEVRETADKIADIREETAWPLASTVWRQLHLDAAGDALRDEPPPSAARTEFDHRAGRCSFRYRFDTDTEVTGPMALRLHVEVEDAIDVSLFVGIRKWHDGQIVGFEGSYGFTHALVTCGWLEASHRDIDPERSKPWAPFHPHTRARPLRSGEIAPVDIGLLPSATLFRAGDELELLVQGRWFFLRNPLFGSFPAGYQRSAKGRTILHCGGEHDSFLLLPTVPGSTT